MTQRTEFGGPMRNRRYICATTGPYATYVDARAAAHG